MIRQVSKKAASRLGTLNPEGTVFAEYTALANKHKAINLGQGFPTLPVGQFILDAASSVISDKCMNHQYTRSEGHIRLVNALASFYSPILKRNIDGLTEIMTTVGASEAIYSTIQAFINEGDEVILMQPYYDSYPASVTLAGGIPRVVSIKPPTQDDEDQNSSGWRLDFDELKAAINPKTKAIIINNPNNPVGKVWTRDELMQVAQIAQEHDLLVIADEVYETLIYSDSVSEMVKFASLPGMFERTITVGSMGKMLGVTGWKIGWIIAPAEITRAAWMVHQFLPFSVVTPLQEAGAISIETALKSNYFQNTSSIYENLRDFLMNTLVKNGFKPMLPHGGYFIICKVDNSLSGDQDFCKWLTAEVGVTPIPMKAFYQKEFHDKVSQYVRFAFCKEKSMLVEADKRLQMHFK